jgi:hypothetical protein
MGPEIGTCIGIDVSVVWMSSSLSSCHASQWSGEVTAVTSAQSTEGRASG